MGQITRICSAALALSALLASQAVAQRKNDGLQLYARARIADAIGLPDLALVAYNQALTAAPDNSSVAIRAYREAVEAGDKAMAMRAARTLERIDALPNDGAILLFIDDVQRSDWRAAERRVDSIEANQSFSFMAAPLRAWMLLGARKGDAMTALDGRITDAIGYELAKEQRALVLLATGQAAAGAEAVRLLTARGVYRTQMRLMAAARLQQLKRVDLAASLLQDNELEFVAARAALEKGLPLPESAATARAGLSELLARVSLIMLAERAPQTALVMARFGRFADSTRSYPRLASAVILNANDRPNAALAELEGLEARPLFARWAVQTRFEVLQKSDRKADALTLAKSIADRPNATIDDKMRLGEAHAALNQQTEAATAFDAAISIVKTARNEAAVPWHFWLQKGRALELAKDWPAARTALQRAVAAGPDQATALNHLGYSMLENGDDAKVALALLARASALRPDDAAITDSLGWAWVKQGDLAKGIPLLELAVEREPALAEINEHLGDAYWLVGRRIDARYSWRNALIQADGSDAKRLAEKIDFGLKAKP